MRNRNLCDAEGARSILVRPLLTWQGSQVDRSYRHTDVRTDMCFATACLPTQWLGAPAMECSAIRRLATQHTKA